MEDFWGNSNSFKIKKQSYKQYLHNQRVLYINKSKELEANTKDFKTRIKILNKVTNKEITLKHDYMQISRDNYLWFVYNQKLLEEKMILDGGYVALFLTLTLDSCYHRYSKTTKQLNPLYQYENTIKKGYELLNQSFREIYKNFKVKRKLEKIYYSKAIEPHKNLTPHLHSIIYVKSEYVAILKNHIKNIALKNQLGRYEFEEIQDISRSTSYLLKYINKNTNPKNDKDYHFFNGWKKVNRIRVFTISSLGLERYLFSKINHHTRLSKRLENKNPINHILQNCNIVVSTRDIRTKEIKLKKYENLESRYDVKVERTRRRKQKIIEVPEEIINIFLNQNQYLSNKLLHTTLENDKLAQNNFSELLNFILEKIYNKATHEQKLKVLIENIKYKNKPIINDMEELRSIEVEKFKKTLKSRYIKYINDNYELANLSEFTINPLENCGDKERFFDIFKSFNIFTYNYKIENFLILDRKEEIEVYNSSNFNCLKKL
ncbi:replication endonuclease [Aliarcobacter cryaerophilus]|uniref:replication endonuclease n=1 Tax=Aliarcobacter cryaerophilus TaxID=28198 RepID=UPI0021B4FBF1|nr:replication endonuclease [Aliarcobacter cryaerophilus]MCT7486284.1 replication endonuclease [Aliarcobacter cryaerophilus]MCT7490347.1 replication endonuclease [Aliarcobacter cryaerophilus]